MPREQTIRVFANPYCALDHEGRPSGAVMFDPVDHHAYASSDQPRRYVGAMHCPERTKVYQKAAEGSAQSDLQDTVWNFSEDAVTLPLSHYYLGHIRSGDLIAADAETAEHAGLAEFVDPKAALARAKVKALDLWKAERPHRALPEWAIPRPEPKAQAKTDAKEVAGTVETTDAPVGEATQLPGSEGLEPVMTATHTFRDAFDSSATAVLVPPTHNDEVK